MALPTTQTRPANLPNPGSPDASQVTQRPSTNVGSAASDSGSGSGYSTKGPDNPMGGNNRDDHNQYTVKLPRGSSF